MNKIITILLTALLLSYSWQASVFADDNKDISQTDHSIKQGEFKGAKDATHPTWFKESFLDLEEDIAEATENNKRLVLYFWQPGCPYCDQLWRDNFADETVVDEFRKHFDIVALNLWGDREVISVGGADYSEKAFGEALGIQYTPTLLFFDENQKVIHQLNGYVPKDNFQKSMAYVSEQHEKSIKFSEFSITESTQVSLPSNTSLNKQDFFIQPILDLYRKQNELSPDMRNKYTVVFFESENCVNCDLLHHKTLKDPDTLALVKQFSSAQLNRFSDDMVITPNEKLTTAKQWATDLGIEYLPAMVFFDPSGKQVMRIDTQLRTFHIQSVFDYVLSGAYKTEANFQRYISARADRIREAGKDVDIFVY